MLNFMTKLTLLSKEPAYVPKFVAYATKPISVERIAQPL